MPIDPRAIAAASGLTGVSAPEPVGGGRSGAAIWRLRRGDVGDLLLRLQTGTGHGQILREAELQRHAAAAGLPVPPVVAAAVVDGSVMLAMPWVEAIPMAAVLSSAPDRASALGVASGRLMAWLHATPLPPPSTARTTYRRWLGLVDPWLSDQVTANPARATLTHGDVHPANLLVGPGDALTLIDWTNADVAHPFIDLGRTFACLRLGAAMRDLSFPDGPIDAWWRAFLAGYGATDRPIDELAPFFAVGLDTLVADVALHGTALPESIPAERDTWLDLARTVAHRPRLT